MGIHAHWDDVDGPQQSELVYSDAEDAARESIDTLEASNQKADGGEKNGEMRGQCAHCGRHSNNDHNGAAGGRGGRGGGRGGKPSIQGGRSSVSYLDVNDPGQLPGQIPEITKLFNELKNEKHRVYELCRPEWPQKGEEDQIRGEDRALFDAITNSRPEAFVQKPIFLAMLKKLAEVDPGSNLAEGLSMTTSIHNHAANVLNRERAAGSKLILMTDQDKEDCRAGNILWMDVAEPLLDQSLAIGAEGVISTPGGLCINKRYPFVKLYDNDGRSYGLKFGSKGHRGIEAVRESSRHNFCPVEAMDSSKAIKSNESRTVRVDDWTPCVGSMINSRIYHWDWSRPMYKSAQGKPRLNIEDVPFVCDWVQSGNNLDDGLNDVLNSYSLNNLLRKQYFDVSGINFEKYELVNSNGSVEVLRRKDDRIVYEDEYRYSPPSQSAFQNSHTSVSTVHGEYGRYRTEYPTEDSAYREYSRQVPGNRASPTWRPSIHSPGYATGSMREGAGLFAAQSPRSTGQHGTFHGSHNEHRSQQNSGGRQALSKPRAMVIESAGWDDDTVLTDPNRKRRLDAATDDHGTDTTERTGKKRKKSKRKSKTAEELDDEMDDYFTAPPPGLLTSTEP